MPGPAEDVTAAAAATKAGAAADAEPAHQDGLQSETHVTSHVTTRSNRHRPAPSEEESRAKRPKQELSETEQRVKRPKQKPCEEEACAESAQLSQKRQDAPQSDAHTANTAKGNHKAELAESAQQSNGANHTDSSVEHKLHAQAGSAAELDSDSDSGSESQSQGEQRHLQPVMCAASLCCVALNNTLLTKSLTCIAMAA